MDTTDDDISKLKWDEMATLLFDMIADSKTIGPNKPLFKTKAKHLQEEKRTLGQIGLFEPNTKTMRNPTK